MVSVILGLVGCADQKTSPKSTVSWCCLVDPERGSLLMPDTPASRASLEAWVNRNASHLSISGGAKPRFVLIHVGADLRIKDQMPLADQPAPGAPHRLTPAEAATLRACFQGGTKVKIDWPTKTVQRL